MFQNKIFLGALALILIILAIYFTKAKDSTAPTEEPAQTSEDTTKPEDMPDIEGDTVVMTVQGFGDIIIQVNKLDAPKTSANFLRLVKDGFYNGLTFHRITDLTGDPENPGRILQGGDPLGNGLGGPGYTVPAEIKLKHEKGAIAMARTGDQVNPKRESSGSQFYIAVDPLPFLDGQYTVFGKVIGGMDIVEKISSVKTDIAGMPDSPVTIEKAVIK